MAVVLPSKLPATSVARSPASLASEFMRSSSCSRPPSRSSSLLTSSVAPCAAIASPITSPSFDSRFVSSATFAPFVSSFASLEPSRERPGEPALAHLALRSLDRVCDAMERSKPPFEIEQEPGGAPIAVARLADRARVEEPSAGELELGSGRGDAANDRFAVECERQRHVAVADENQRCFGQLERRAGRLFGEDVFPDRVARARVEDLH